MNVGDTVYVALGPNVSDGSDSFGVGYQLDTFSDASVVAWDANGTLPVDGGTGNWDTTSARWFQYSGAGSYTTWNNAANLNATFGPAAGTTTLTEPITARSLDFAAGGYTVNGASTLTLTGAGAGGPGPATISAASGTPTTINVPIASSTHVNKVGSGTVVLTANNSFGAELRAAGGNLVLGGTSANNPSVVGVGVSSSWVAAGTSGTLTVQDSASLTTTYINMGENWPFISGMTAVINQTGGTVTTTGNSGENAAIRIGHWGNETSTYNLSGGVLNITGAGNYLTIATDGTGIFNQTGGEAFAPGVIVNHRNPGGNATFAVRGGTFNVGSYGIQTAGGPAAVIVGGSGGTIKASADFGSPLNMTLNGTGGNAAHFDTNGNTITLSGTLSGSGSLNKIGAGTLVLSGNAVNIGGRLDVANGTVDLTNSTVTTGGSGTHVANRFTTNVDPINAVLNINAGSSLTTHYIVGGDGSGSNINGTINQYDGTTVTTTGATDENNGVRLGHYPGGNITYNLIGGTLDVGAGFDLSCATDGTGHFHQTGGTLNVERIVVNKRGGSGGDGTLTLEGGTANIGGGGIITDSTADKAHVNYGGLGAIVRATASFASPLAATLSGSGANAVHFDTNGNTITLSGALTGTGFMKAGAGTLELTGTGTVIDTMVLNGGTTVLGGSSTTTVNSYVGIGDTASAVLVIQDSATLNANNSFYVGESDGIQGDVIQTGGAVTIGGQTRIAHWPNETSTYTLSGGSLTANGLFNVGWDGTGVFTQSGGSSAFNGSLTVGAHGGPGGTVNMDGGTMTVTHIRLGDWGGATGTLNITDGSITAGSMNAGDANGATGVVHQTGGTFTINGNTRIAHWPNNTSTYTLDDGTFISNGTFSLGWDGTGIFTQNGGTSQFGNIHISDSTGTGTLNVNGGTMAVTGDLGVAENSGSAGQVNQTGGDITVANLLRVGHWPNNTSTYTMSGGTLTLTGTPSGVVNSGGVGEQAGILYLGVDGTGVFTQTGGTASAHGIVLDARGNTTGTDTFTLDAGTFVAGPSGIKSGNYDANTSYQINLGGGTLSARADWASTLNMALTGAVGNAVIDTNGHTITLSGQLSGSGGLEKIGAGTLAITSTNSNFAGPTTVSGGTLSVSNGRLYDVGWQDRAITITNGAVLEVGGWGDGDTFGIGRVSFNSANIVLDDGTIRYTATGFGGRRDRGFTIGAGGATLEAAGSIPWVISAERNFPIVSNAGGTLSLTGSSDGQIDKVIPGTGSLVKNGSGTWTLTARNTYSGDTTVNDGTLILDAPNSASSAIGAGTLTINPGATVSTNVNGFGWNYENPIVINQGTLNSFGADSHLNTVTMTEGLMTGLEFRPHMAITTNAAANSAVIDVSTLRLYGNIPFNVADGGAGIDLDVTSTVRGAGSVEKNGAGTMRMTRSANDYSGGTVVNDGVLLLQGQNNGQSTVGTSTITINPGGVVTAQSHNVFGHTSAANIPHVHINGGVLNPYQYLHVDTVEMTGGTINSEGGVGSGLQTHDTVFTGNASPDTAFIHARIQTLTGDITFDIADGAADPDMHVTNQIYGGNGFTKTGAGTLLLSGTNTYSGATAVNGGTLQLDGTHTGGAAYTVANGATLGGTGATTSHVIVQQGGTLAPDGSLATGELDLEALSFLTVGLDALTVFDNVVVTGTVDVTDAQLLLLLGYAPNNGDYFVIVDNDGTADAVAGTFLGLPEGGRIFPGEPYGFWISYQGGDGNDISLLAVPEPTTLSLLGLGALAALIRRRRRRA